MKATQGIFKVKSKDCEVHVIIGLPDSNGVDFSAQNGYSGDTDYFFF